MVDCAVSEPDAAMSATKAASFKLLLLAQMYGPHGGGVSRSVAIFVGLPIRGCDTDSMKTRVGLLSAAIVCLIGIHACANINEADQRKKEAQTQGKYYVELTD